MTRTPKNPTLSAIQTALATVQKETGRFDFDSVSMNEKVHAELIKECVKSGMGNAVAVAIDSQSKNPLHDMRVYGMTVGIDATVPDGHVKVFACGAIVRAKI